MNMEEIYQDTKPLVINNCEFSHQINDIIYSDKIKDGVKSNTSNTTNIIVTKYADSTSDILNVEPTLDLVGKEKIIEVELLSTNKNNISALFNGTLLKNSFKKKINTSDKNYSQVGVKKKRINKQSFERDFLKNPDLVAKSDFSESLSEGVTCNECNKQFTSEIVMKKHLLTCKVVGTAICSKCGKHFSSNYNLKRHMTSCKLCPDNEKSPRFMCQCGRTYSQEWDMKKHRSKCKEGKKKCKHCLISNCNLLFYHKAQLIAHMKKDHNMIIQDPKVLNFNSFDEFLLWKEREEEETFTYYSKQTGSNVSGVSVNTYYVCQRDGSDRTHTSTPRKTERRNKKGRIKTGRLCWSQMNVKQFKDGTVKVTYFPSHTHPVSIADTEHHPLPSSITMEIKRRFSEISKLSENEDPLSDENQEMKKGKRKRYGMSIRTLKALARKNRRLFRITAEAMQKPDENKEGFDSRNNFQFTCQKGHIIPANSNIKLHLSENEEENVDDPDPVVQAFNEAPTNEIRPNDKDILEDCINYLNDVKLHVLSGKLPQSVLIQVRESLKNMCYSWENDFQESSIVPKSENLSECQEVTMSPLPVTEIFPLQDVSATMDSTNDLKCLETSEKAVYQVISVNNEEKPNSEYLCESTIEGTTPREFIIIAAEHAQWFQTVDSNIQFDLS